MFEFRSDLPVVPWDAEAVLEFYISANQPQISAEGEDAQEAQACFYSDRNGAEIKAYIALYMCASKRLLVYGWSEPITRSDYTDVQAAAIQFTESMGFMMDDLQMRKRDASERLELLRDFPGFTAAAASLSSDEAAVEEDLETVEEEGVVVELDESQSLPPDETILDLQADLPSTQVDGRRPSIPKSAPAGDPLEDKNFKVFLRLLTSA